MKEAQKQARGRKTLTAWRDGQAGSSLSRNMAAIENRYVWYVKIFGVMAAADEESESCMKKLQKAVLCGLAAWLTGFDD